jgi:hypothetical protein
VEIIANFRLDRIGFLLIVSPSRAAVDVVYANYNARGHPGVVTATPPPTGEDRLVDLTAVHAEQSTTSFATSAWHAADPS